MSALLRRAPLLHRATWVDFGKDRFYRTRRTAPTMEHSSPTAYWAANSEDLRLERGQRHFLHIDDQDATTLRAILNHGVEARRKARAPPYSAPRLEVSSQLVKS